MELASLRSEQAVRAAALYEREQEARAAAEGASRAKDEFLAMLGHELRNPLAPMALTTVAGFRPEVALLDIGLPVMDGYELAGRLRERPELAGLRLVAVSGYGQEADRTRSRAAGFDAHLVKPVDIDELVALVDRLVET